jgi:Transposase IS66 family
MESVNVYFKDPEIEIDMNLVENVIRPTAIGRGTGYFSETPTLANAVRSFTQSLKIAGVMISSPTFICATKSISATA